MEKNILKLSTDNQARKETCYSSNDETIPKGSKAKRPPKKKEVNSWDCSTPSINEKTPKRKMSDWDSSSECQETMVEPFESNQVENWDSESEKNSPKVKETEVKEGKGHPFLTSSLDSYEISMSDLSDLEKSSLMEMMGSERGRNGDKSHEEDLLLVEDLEEFLRDDNSPKVSKNLFHKKAEEVSNSPGGSDLGTDSEKVRSNHSEGTREDTTIWMIPKSERTQSGESTSKLISSSDREKIERLNVLKHFLKKTKSLSDVQKSKIRRRAIRSARTEYLGSQKINYNHFLTSEGSNLQRKLEIEPNKTKEKILISFDRSSVFFTEYECRTMTVEKDTPEKQSVASESIVNSSERSPEDADTAPNATSAQNAQVRSPEIASEAAIPDIVRSDSVCIDVVSLPDMRGRNSLQERQKDTQREADSENETQIPEIETTETYPMSESWFLLDSTGHYQPVSRNEVSILLNGKSADAVLQGRKEHFIPKATLVDTKSLRDSLSGIHTKESFQHFLKEEDTGGEDEGKKSIDLERKVENTLFYIQPSMNYTASIRIIPVDSEMIHIWRRTRGSGSVISSEVDLSHPSQDSVDNNQKIIDRHSSVIRRPVEQTVTEQDETSAPEPDLPKPLTERPKKQSQESQTCQELQKPQKSQKCQDSQESQQCQQPQDSQQSQECQESLQSQEIQESQQSYHSQHSQQSQQNQQFLESHQSQKDQQPLESYQPQENQQPLESHQLQQNQQPLESYQPQQNQQRLESQQPQQNQQRLESQQSQQKQQPLESQKSQKDPEEYQLSQRNLQPEETEQDLELEESHYCQQYHYCQESHQHTEYSHLLMETRTIVDNLSDNFKTIQQRLDGETNRSLALQGEVNDLKLFLKKFEGRFPEKNSREVLSDMIANPGSRPSIPLISNKSDLRSESIIEECEESSSCRNFEEQNSVKEDEESKNSNQTICVKNQEDDSTVDWTEGNDIITVNIFTVDSATPILQSAEEAQETYNQVQANLAMIESKMMRLQEENEMVMKQNAKLKRKLKEISIELEKYLASTSQQEISCDEAKEVDSLRDQVCNLKLELDNLKIDSKTREEELMQENSLIQQEFAKILFSLKDWCVMAGEVFEKVETAKNKLQENGITVDVNLTPETVQNPKSFSNLLSCYVERTFYCLLTIKEENSFYEQAIKENLSKERAPSKDISGLDQVISGYAELIDQCRKGQTTSETESRVMEDYFAVIMEKASLTEEIKILKTENEMLLESQMEHYEKLKQTMIALKDRNSEVSALETSQKLSDDERGKMAEMLKLYEQEKKEMEMEVERKNRTVEELIGRLDRKEMEISDCNERLKAAVEEMKNFEKSSRLKDELINEIKMENDELSNAERIKSNQIEVLKEEIKNLEFRGTQLEAELTSTKLFLNESQKEMTEYISHLETLVNNSQESIDKTKQKLKESHQTINQLKNENDVLDKQHQCDVKLFNTTKDELDSCKEHLLKANAKLKDLEEEREELLKKFESLAESDKEKTEALELLAKEYKAIFNENAELKEKLDVYSKDKEESLKEQKDLINKYAMLSKEVQKLQEKYRSVKSECNQRTDLIRYLEMMLKENLFEYNNRIACLEQNISRIIEKILACKNGMREKHVGVDAEVRELRHQLEVTYQERKELENVIDNYYSLMKHLENEIQEREKKVDELHVRLSLEQQKAVDYDKATRPIQDPPENPADHYRMQELENEIAVTKNELAECKNELHRCQTNHENEKKKLELTIADLRSEIKRYQLRIEVMMKNLTNYNKNTNGLTTDKRSAEDSELEKLRKELQEKNKLISGLNDAVSKCKAEVEMKDSDLENSRKKSLHLDEELKNLQNQIAKMQGAMTATTKTSEIQQKERDELAEKLFQSIKLIMEERSARQTIESLAVEKEKTFKDQIDKIKNELLQKTKECDALSGTLETKKKLVSKLQSDLKKMKWEVASLRRQISEKRNESTRIGEEPALNTSASLDQMPTQKVSPERLESCLRELKEVRDLNLQFRKTEGQYQAKIVRLEDEVRDARLLIKELQGDIKTEKKSKKAFKNMILAAKMEVEKCLLAKQLMTVVAERISRHLDLKEIPSRELLSGFRLSDSSSSSKSESNAEENYISEIIYRFRHEDSNWKMFVTQHLTPRWKKEWIPLATQQLRLRNLIQILAFSIENDKKETVGTKSMDSEVNGYLTNESYYFTLHATIMSAPLYTSEKLKSVSPQWKELRMSSWGGDVCNSIDALVIRLWFNSPQEPKDRVLAVWGVYLSGLTYLGPSLRADIPLKPNSLVFLMSGGYFTDPKCIDSSSKVRLTSVIVNQNDVRMSYSVSSLTRLQALQQVIRKELSEAEVLKKKISMGDFFGNESRGRTTLRKLLSKHKPKTHHADLMRVKGNIEIAKYRVNILREEKKVLLERLKELEKQIQCCSDSNLFTESKIMENYRLLKREILSHREWKRSYIDRREKYLHSRAMLNFRTKQLISELNLIYPIDEISPEKYTICGVHLPNSEDFTGHDDLQISIALGFVTHIMQMISIFLQIPLRYPVIHFGSRSKIIDEISEKIPDSEREFCLFVKGREKLQFRYAVYLLNKNIAQMRWLCGLPTSDLRNTLENLASLVKMKFGSSNLDQTVRSLSSSTADICSSTVSVSSPLGSVMSYQTKRNPRIHHLSESGMDSGRRGGYLSSYVPGHRVSKSVGSSKDLMLNVLTKKNLNCEKNVNSNLSFSLDKGLNEYEEVNSAKEGQYGSEPSLNSSAEVPKSLQSEAKVEFLNTWNAESQKVPFSDDDSEAHMIDDRVKKQLGECSKTAQEEVKDNCQEKNDGDAAEAPIVDMEKPSVQQEDSTSVKNEPLQCDTREDSSDVKKCDVEDAVFLTDSLLENVTSRTEALANQTTCFNRFRTRFKSTLESSN